MPDRPTFSSLPYDYARCFRPEGCPHASRCLRNTPGAEKHQSYSLYDGGVDCDGLITAETRMAAWQTRGEVAR